VCKLKPVLRCRRKMEGLVVSLELVGDSYVLSLFVKQPDREKFRDFLARIGEKLGEIVDYVWF